MKEKNILKIAKYQCQLAELETQFWFNGLNAKFFKVNHDRIKEEIRRLEE